MRIQLLLLAMFCAFSPLVGQSTMPFTISGLMGQGDQEAIGIHNLSPAEQQAFEAWINLWTIKTINHVLTKGCKCSAQECVNSLYQQTSGGAVREPPSRPQVPEQPLTSTRTDQVEQIETTDYNLITDVLRHGGLIRLNNGTTWEVSPPDQTTTARWQRRDKVQLIPSATYGNYTLSNLTRHQQVTVAHPGEALRLDPFLGDTYRKSITKNVRDNVNNGEVIILDDGSTFEIRLADRSTVTSSWGPGTVVSVTKKGGMYPYSLKNAQNGDTAEARLR